MGQAVAFTAAGIRRRRTSRPGGHSEPETRFCVRRGEYIPVEVQVSWIPAAHPLRKECYTLQRGEHGVVSAVTTRARGCRLTTHAVTSTVSLCGTPLDAHAR